MYSRYPLTFHNLLSVQLPKQNLPQTSQAKNIIIKLISDIVDGKLTLTKTFRSAFIGAYNKSIERSSKMASTYITVDEQPSLSKPVKFYNRLEEVEGRPQNNSSGH